MPYEARNYVIKAKTIDGTMWYVAGHTMLTDQPHVELTAHWDHAHAFGKSAVGATVAELRQLLARGTIHTTTSRYRITGFYVFEARFENVDMVEVFRKQDGRCADETCTLCNCTTAQFARVEQCHREGWLFCHAVIGGLFAYRHGPPSSFACLYGDCLVALLERIKNHVQGEALWTTISTQTRCTKPKRRGCCTS